MMCHLTNRKLVTSGRSTRAGNMSGLHAGHFGAHGSSPTTLSALYSPSLRSFTPGVCVQTKLSQSYFVFTSLPSKEQCRGVSCSIFYYQKKLHSNFLNSTYSMYGKMK